MLPKLRGHCKTSRKRENVPVSNSSGMDRYLHKCNSEDLEVIGFAQLWPSVLANTALKSPEAKQLWQM